LVLGMILNSSTSWPPTPQVTTKGRPNPTTPNPQQLIPLPPNPALPRINSIQLTSNLQQFVRHNVKSGGCGNDASLRTFHYYSGHPSLQRRTWRLLPQAVAPNPMSMFRLSTPTCERGFENTKLLSRSLGMNYIFKIFLVHSTSLNATQDFHPQSN
jgi:hypothetical protein